MHMHNRFFVKKNSHDDLSVVAESDVKIKKRRKKVSAPLFRFELIKHRNNTSGSHCINLKRYGLGVAWVCADCRRVHCSPLLAVPSRLSSHSPAWAARLTRSELESIIFETRASFETSNRSVQRSSKRLQSACVACRR